MDVAFRNGELSIGMIIRNHLGISLLARSIPRLDNYVIDYGELLGISKGYIVGHDFGGKSLFEGDSLLAVRSLIRSSEDLFELRAIC